MRKPLISVVITHVSNPALSLEATLKAMEAQQFDRAFFECIVVDNGSNKDLLASLVCNRWSSNLTTLSVAPTVSRSVSRNRGWKAAQGQLIAFLDGDMLPTPNWLEAYEQAFADGAPDIVSGSRYCLQMDRPSSTLTSVLSRLMCADVSDLFRRDIYAQYLSLASHAVPGQHPSPWFRDLELQMHAVCQEYPTSRLRGYSFMDSNVAATKDVLDASGGFDPFLNKGEDFDLGIRMAELGYKFATTEYARAYHLDCSTQAQREWTALERHAFLYRHPYRSTAMVSLCESVDAGEIPLEPGLLPRGILDIAALESDVSCTAWHTLLDRVPSDVIPGSFDYSEMAMIRHFSEAGGIDETVVRKYLSVGLSDGLMVRRSPEHLYFDIHHTSNWLRTKTRFQEYWLKNASFGRNHLTPRQSGKSGADPIKIHCNGRYVIEIDVTARMPWDRVAVNMTLPIEHYCQTNLCLRRLAPAALGAYLDKCTGIISNVPSALWLDSGTIVCEFECDIAEGILSAGIISKECVKEIGHNIESEHLRFTFPVSCMEKAKSLLDYILGNQRKDSETDIKRIYHWAVENLSYTNNSLPDYSVLDTGMGTCAQLTRLFANLVRLLGVPAKEQCGALMTRSTSASDLMTITTGHSPFAHTWAEVYLENRGWFPIDLVVMGYGEWQLTPFNVRPDIRAEIASQASQLLKYYFGCIDPYRIYAHPFANKMNAITVRGSTKTRHLIQQLLVCVRHSLMCSIRYLSADGQSGC
jgi:glycosyltransferase involved in cell wall biosynthesis